MELKGHWETIYGTKAPNEVSWYQTHLNQSLQLILRTGVTAEANIIDVGGGASTLVDDLLARRFKHVSILDISSKALETSKSRLGKRAANVTWIEGDVTETILPEYHFDVWHDRAVFHFLTAPGDRHKYVSKLKHSLKPEGYVIIATFSLNGPSRCSGLDVVRYSPETLRGELGKEFQLMESFSEVHSTPSNTKQEFVYCYFKRWSLSQ